MQIQFIIKEANHTVFYQILRIFYTMVCKVRERKYRINFCIVHSAFIPEIRTKMKGKKNRISHIINYEFMTTSYKILTAY